MYETGYERLFLGMLIIIFDINLGYINILPNFIGYLFILSALSILKTQYKSFEKGKAPCILLTLLTIRDVYHNPQNDLFSGEFNSSGIPTLLIGSVITLLNLYLIFIICKSIYELCEERFLYDLKDYTKHYFILYLIGTGAFLLYYPFSINFSISQNNCFLIVLSIIQIIFSLCIAFLFRKCKSILNS